VAIDSEMPGRLSFSRRAFSSMTLCPVALFLFDLVHGFFQFFRLFRLIILSLTWRYVRHGPRAFILLRFGCLGCAFFLFDRHGFGHDGLIFQGLGSLPLAERPAHSRISADLTRGAVKRRSWPEVERHRSSHRCDLQRPRHKRISRPRLSKSRDSLAVSSTLHRNVLARPAGLEPLWCSRGPHPRLDPRPILGSQLLAVPGRTRTCDPRLRKANI
jgi:hypothetical protein